MPTDDAKPISPSAVVKRLGKFPSRAVDGQGIVVATDKGAAILMNGVGFQLWSHIDDSRTVSQLTALVGQRFKAVPEERIQGDICAFLRRLEDLALIELQ